VDAERLRDMACKWSGWALTPPIMFHTLLMVSPQVKFDLLFKRGQVVFWSRIGKHGER
jgi:hypothetical protein